MNNKPPSVRCENCGLIQRYDKQIPLCRHCRQPYFSTDIIDPSAEEFYYEDDE